MKDTETKKWNGYQLRLEGDGQAFFEDSPMGVNFHSMEQFVKYLDKSAGARETYFRNNPKYGE